MHAQRAVTAVARWAGYRLLPTMGAAESQSWAAATCGVRRLCGLTTTLLARLEWQVARTIGAARELGVAVTVEVVRGSWAAVGVVWADVAGGARPTDERALDPRTARRLTWYVLPYVSHRGRLPAGWRSAASLAAAARLNALVGAHESY
jgi:hypothetical protein